MKRIRQKDIAEALGLHRSTVSKALKGDPAIKAVTREAVRRAAEEMGFRPDPMLTALAQYRKREPAVHRATVGWICNYPKSMDMSLYAGHADYFAGARKRCHEMGYKLEPIWVDGRSISVRRLPEILKARGIQAVIFAPQARVGVEMEFPIDRFCSLTIGYSLASPQMDVITNDHFTTMTGILERLHAEGSHRIGCYLWETDNERMGRRARSAFLAYSREYGCCVGTYREFNEKVFLGWLQKQSPEALVVRGPAQAAVVCQHNRKCRQPIRVCGYAIDPQEKKLSGMSHNNYQIGIRATEWISSKLERGQFGAPIVPQRLLIAGTWVEND